MGGDAPGVALKQRSGYHSGVVSRRSGVLSCALSRAIRFCSHPNPTARSEWAVNHQRDAIASHLGHHDMLTYFAVAQNEAAGRTKFNMLEKMVQPCGPPPAKPAEQ